jgi:hypothetical protein
MTSAYHDRWIDVADDGLRIRGYYFPWGTKRIAYSAIRGARRVHMTAMRGKWRIWGTADPRYWASFDPGRPRKTVGFIVDVGRRVKPFVTPDDPDAFGAALKLRAGVDAAESDGV